MAAASSAIDDFRRKLGEYSSLHNQFPDQKSEFIKDIDAIENASAIASKLPGDTIFNLVEKIAKYKELALNLNALSPEIQVVIDGIKGNNSNLEQLRLQIKPAIDQAKIAAAEKAAAAAAAAADAAAAQQALSAALSTAQSAVDSQIKLLREYKTKLENDAERELTNKTLLVTEKSREITNKGEKKKQKLSGKDYISETTRLLVNDITQQRIPAYTSIQLAMFEKIANKFKQENTQTHGNIDRIIKALEDSKSSNIDAMTEAVRQAGLLPNYTALTTFQSDVNTLVTDKLDPKIAELDDNGKTSNVVNDAIASDLRIFQEEEDKLQEIANTVARFNAEIDSKSGVITGIKKDFQAKKLECDAMMTQKQSNENVPQIKQMKSMQLNSLITGLNTILLKLSNEIDRYLNPEFVNSLNDNLDQIRSRRKEQNITVSVQPVTQALEAKILELSKVKTDLTSDYEQYDAIQELNKPDMQSQSRSPSPILESGSAPPPRPPSPLLRRAKPTGTPSSAALSAKPPPKHAWMTDPKAVAATASLSPPRIDSDDQSSVILKTRQRNYIYIPIEKTGQPSVPILVIVPDSDRGTSPTSVRSLSRGGSRSKHSHRKQSGGANLPDEIPPNIEMYEIDYTKPGFAEFISSLKTPHELLINDQTSSGVITENPIITKLKNGGRIPDTRMKQMYTQIKDDLIDDDDDDILSIGQKVVYKGNIVELVKLLDIALNTGGRYAAMYNKLWKFMAFAEGSTIILLELFESINPKIVNNDFDSQRKILGWGGRRSNANLKKLFDVFSKCPAGGRIKFLYDTGYIRDDEAKYRFMLNWIMLLAFHSVNKGSSEMTKVGELITKIHYTFLGWMVGQDVSTFRGMFDPTTKPSVEVSIKTYSDRIDKNITGGIAGDPSLFEILNDIQNTLCKLGTVVESDDDSDTDWSKSDTDDDSGSGSDSGTPPLQLRRRSERISKQKGSPRGPPPVPIPSPRSQSHALSYSTGVGHTRDSLLLSQGTTSPSPPLLSPSPPPPPVPRLNLNQASNKSSLDSQRRLLDNLHKQYVPGKAAGSQSAKTLQDTASSRALDQGSGEDPGQRQRLRPSFFTTRIQPLNESNTVRVPPVQGSQTARTSGPTPRSNQVAPSKPSVFTHGEPIQPKQFPTSAVDTAHQIANSDIIGTNKFPSYTSTSTPTTGVRVISHAPLNPRQPSVVSLRKVKNTGGRTKRTRKHKKHMSTSASRRSTRRRNTKPTPEKDHKYTRKHTRT